MQIKNPLTQWLVSKGCHIHPSLLMGNPITSTNTQGVTTIAPICHKTMIFAVPVSLIITVKRCLSHPQLHSLFKSQEDDLFNYEEDEGQFNILAVFLLFQKLKGKASEWYQYIGAMSPADTAVDWSKEQLDGLPRALVQQILVVQKECKELEDEMMPFLISRKEFNTHTEEKLRKEFYNCYKKVLSRTFGIYFDQPTLIPGLDFFNHSCEVASHELINTQFQSTTTPSQIPQTYHPKCKGYDCTLLSLPTYPQRPYPKNIQFLLQSNLTTPSQTSTLSRPKINDLLSTYYNKRKDIDLDEMQFFSEDDSENNDTDEDMEEERQYEMEALIAQEKEQMEEFRTNYVKVDTYASVEKKLKEIGMGPKKGKKGKKEVNIPINVQQGMDSDEDNQANHKNSSWAYNPTSYFVILIDKPLATNDQIFISYGQRTNKFLLTWYGFTYKNNHYDSVSLRLHAKFTPELAPAQNIILDSQMNSGKVFKHISTSGTQKTIKDTQVSKEFRLKRSRIDQQLLMFLRLYLLNYYKQQDLYKVFVTFPSSLSFQLYTLQYYLQIVQGLYNRYPLAQLQKLQQKRQEVIKQESSLPCYDFYGQQQIQEITRLKESKNQLTFKLTFLQEQRSILDDNVEALQKCMEILRESKEMKCMYLETEGYRECDVKVLRRSRDYLHEVYDNYQYIVYEQKERTEEEIAMEVEMEMEKEKEVVRQKGQQQQQQEQQGQQGQQQQCQQHQQQQQPHE